jgi:hypothetical protein
LLSESHIAVANALRRLNCQSQAFGGRRSPASRGQESNEWSLRLRARLGITPHVATRFLINEGCISLCPGIYWMNANDETFHFPLRLGNARAWIWCTGPDRAAYCRYPISQERGGAQLLSIPVGANAVHTRSPSRDQGRIREDLPTAISCNA